MNETWLLCHEAEAGELSTLSITLRQLGELRSLESTENMAILSANDLAIPQRILQAAIIGVDAAQVPIVKGILQAALFVVQVAQEVKVDHDACKELAERCAEISTNLSKNRPFIDASSTNPDMMNSLVRFKETLDEISGTMVKLANRALWKRILQQPARKDEIQKYTQKLDQAQKDFHLDSSIRTEATSHRVEAAVDTAAKDIIQRIDQSVSQVQQTLQIRVSTDSGSTSENDFKQLRIELDTFVNTSLAAAGSNTYKNLFRSAPRKGRTYIVRSYPNMTHEALLEESKRIAILFHPSVVQLAGISPRASPAKYIAFYDPNVTTYARYKKHIRGFEYREFDKKYDRTYMLGLEYVKLHLDGLTLECIHTEIRTVKHNGEAIIIVPDIPRDQSGRASLATSILRRGNRMIERRLEISKTVVRCPACLPTVRDWYQSLADDTKRLLQNISVAEDTDAEHQNQLALVRSMRDADALLGEAANAVIVRSENCVAGSCGWCGSRWDHGNKTDKNVGVEAAKVAMEQASIDRIPKRSPRRYLIIMVVVFILVMIRARMGCLFFFGFTG